MGNKWASRLPLCTLWQRDRYFFYDFQDAFGACKDPWREMWRHVKGWLQLMNFASQCLTGSDRFQISSICKDFSRIQYTPMKSEILGPQQSGTPDVDEAIKCTWINDSDDIPHPQKSWSKVYNLYTCRLPCVLSDGFRCLCFLLDLLH